MEQEASLSVFWHEDFLAHEPPAGEFEAEWSGRLADRERHPDRPERLRNVRHIVDEVLTDCVDVDWRSARKATAGELERVHDASYLEEFREFCANGGGRVTPTTGANEATYPAARRAAGAAVQAARAALEEDTVPYALVRPSGHHAQSDRADGFCFLNNVAVGAADAIATGRADRVAVVDWDVHHGNGTQEIFYDRDDVLVVNVHNDHGAWDPDTHPQTGRPDERGVGAGEGYTINAPVPPGTGDEGYAHVFDRLVAPAVDDFDPDLVLVSAGGDPGTVDPLGRNVLTKDGFEALGRRAADLADGAVAFVQEGGYQPSHLGYAQLGVLEGALGVDAGVADPFEWLAEDFALLRPRLDEVVAAHENHWPTVASTSD
jgi:acetoin utilization deacetylase AcuC-like enzyme